MDIPPAGRIDLHSHLLPGVDDGCRTVDDSLECVRKLISRGFVGSVCTPHMWPAMFPQNMPQTVGPAVTSLQEQIDAAGLTYRLWPGGELRLDPFIDSWVKEVGVPTLGPGRCVLVDFWGVDWPDDATEMCRWLVAEGYQPVLAHPERMGFDETTLKKVLSQMREVGVWLQGNIGCMVGESGPTAAMWVRRLLREERYRVMALDMHGPESLELRIEGLALLEIEAGRDKLDEMFIDAPRRILTWGCDAAGSG